MLYWVTIMFSQTLGTALGDWTADTAALGYRGAAVVFSALLALVAAVYYWTKLSRTTLFWAAFILTRPLGAVVGDLLDKPVNAEPLFSLGGPSSVYCGVHLHLSTESCEAGALIARERGLMSCSGSLLPPQGQRVEPTCMLPSTELE